MGATREFLDNAANGVEPGLEIQRADDGLERRRQNGFAGATAHLLLAAPQSDEPTELERRAPARQIRARDERRARRGEHAHRGRRCARKKLLGHDQTERGVADEGEPVLRDQRRVLVDVGSVRERALEQCGIGEAMTERFFDGPQAWYLRNASVALVPPKPNAFESAVSMSCLRAWFGT